MQLQVRLSGENLTVSQQGEPASILFSESDAVFFTDPNSMQSFEFVNIGDTYQLNMDWKGATWKGFKQ